MKQIYAYGTLLVLSLVIPSAPVQADLGNSIYVPVSPCRVGDTRQLTPTTIAAGAFVEWSAYGSDMSLQGGSASGCEQPKTGRNPIGAALNITAVASQAVGLKGNLTAYPADEAKPVASTLNYTQGTNLANSTIVGLCQDGSCDGKFKLESGVTDVPALVDVLGYFYPSPGNVANVAISGGDYTSPVDAITDIANWCGTPTATNPCLVKIAAGTYDLGATQLIVPAFVSVQGSGQNLTILNGSVDSADGIGIVQLNGSGISLSDLTVTNTNGTTVTMGVTVGATAQDVLNWKIQNVTSTATSTGGVFTIGIYIINATSCDGGEMINVNAAASGGATNVRGVESDCLGGNVTVTNLSTSGSGISSDLRGYANFSFGATILRNSSFTGGTESVFGGAGVVKVISSELSGTVGGSNVSCVGDYDNNGEALIDGVFGAGGCVTAPPPPPTGAPASLPAVAFIPVTR